jgi:hypothetical protein
MTRDALFVVAGERQDEEHNIFHAWLPDTHSTTNWLHQGSRCNLYKFAQVLLCIKFQLSRVKVTFLKTSCRRGLPTCKLKQKVW